MSDEYLHNHEALSQLYRALDAQMKCGEQLIEKDYWLMHCIYSLQKIGLSFELKGGTSLSKGWEIIRRFSEDVDIHIHPPKEMQVYSGRNHNHKRHRDSREAFFDWVKDKLIIPGITEVERDPLFDDEKARNVGLRLHYESTYPPLPGLKRSILLEVGFATTVPNEKKTIRSWALTRALESGLKVIDNSAPDVPCYFPEYTLVEKLGAIAAKYRQEQESGQLPENFIRHYYDIHQLLQTTRVQQFIGTPAYHEHKKKAFRKTDREIPISQNEAFRLSSFVLRRKYEEAYRATERLYYGEKPTFDEIMARIEAHLPRL